MRVRGRRLAAVMGVVLVAIVVAGCGSSSSDSSSKDSGTSSSGSSSKATASAPAKADPAEVTKLVTKVYGAPTPADKLPPTVLEALQIAAAPISPSLKEKFMSCLGKPVCQTGYPNAKLVIGAPIDNTTNPTNRQGQAISLLQALRYPNVKTILMPDGGGDVQKINSDFRSMVSQGAKAIIGNWVTGATMAAVGKQAQQQGVLISTLNNNIAGMTPGDKYIFIGNDLCQYGDYQAAAALDGTKKTSGGKYTLLTGIPGNPYAAGWQPCTKKTLDGKGWSQASTGTTNWTPQGNAQAATAIISSGKNPDAILYDGECTQVVKAYQDAKKQSPMLAAAGVAPSCVNEWAQAKADGRAFPAYAGNSQVWNYSVGVTAALDRLAGKSVPNKIPLALPLVPFQTLIDNEPDYKQYPAATAFQSTLPLDATLKLLGGS